jgi:hypothetical protein
MGPLHHAFVCVFLNLNKWRTDMNAKNMVEYVNTAFMKRL